MALASVYGPFGVHLLTFILPTPVHWCTIWGHWNFRLEFVMPQSQHTRDLPNLFYDCDLWKHLVFRLLLALFRLVGLSKWRIIEPSHCFHRISFCSPVYTYIHGMCYLTSRSTWVQLKLMCITKTQWRQFVVILVSLTLESCLFLTRWRCESYYASLCCLQMCF